MSTVKSTWAELEEVIESDPTLTDESIAIKFLRDCVGVSLVQSKKLVPLIAVVVNSRRRQHDHSAEQDAFDVVVSSRRTAEGVYNPIEARRKVVATTFIIERGGQRISWGAATVDDHKARIVYLESFREGIARTIGYHRRAIELIEAEGVKCLAAVKGALNVREARAIEQGVNGVEDAA